MGSGAVGGADVALTAGRGAVGADLRYVNLREGMCKGKVGRDFGVM